MDASIVDRLQCYRALEGPDWRWTLAQRAALGREQRLLGIADVLVRDATRYVRLCRDERPDQARNIAARIAAAVDLDAIAREELMIMVLGRWDRPRIAARLEIDVETVETWELLFWDVRDATSDVIVANIILPLRRDGHLELAAKLNLARAAGPLGAEVILELGSASAVTEADKWIRKRIQLSLRVDAALALSNHSERGCLRIIEIAAKIIAAEQRLAQDERRLVERCREAQRKHELAQLRLEARLRREQSAPASPTCANQPRRRKRQPQADASLLQEMRQSRDAMTMDQVLIARMDTTELQEIDCCASSDVFVHGSRELSDPPDAWSSVDLASGASGGVQDQATVADSWIAPEVLPVDAVTTLSCGLAIAA